MIICDNAHRINLCDGHCACGVSGSTRIIGVNDAGYVFLPDNRGYAIVVFISDSANDMETTEKMIADISEIIYDYYKK